MPLDILIEGWLFLKAAPVKKSALQKQFSLSEEELSTALQTLAARLLTGATRLVETTSEVQLATAAELAPHVEAWQKSDIKSDIGKAGAETLAIILYRGPVTRTEIDRIRGVNSSFIVRNLLVRGLIERQPAAQGGGYALTATPALLMQLGVTNQRELTDFSRIVDALEKHEPDLIES